MKFNSARRCKYRDLIVEGAVARAISMLFCFCVRAGVWGGGGGPRQILHLMAAACPSHSDEAHKAEHHHLLIIASSIQFSSMVVFLERANAKRVRGGHRAAGQRKVAPPPLLRHVPRFQIITQSQSTNTQNWSKTLDTNTHKSRERSKNRGPKNSCAPNANYQRPS